MDVTGNVMLDEPNEETTRVISQGWIRRNQAGLVKTGNDEFTFTKRIYIPHKKTYRFGPQYGGLTYQMPEVYFTVVCYVVFGSLITDNIAYFQTFTEGTQCM